MEILIMAYIIGLFAIFLGRISDDNIFFKRTGTFLTVKDIYNSSELNKFGSISIFILYRIFTPIVAIAQFIYWIAHIGRKD